MSGIFRRINLKKNLFQYHLSVLFASGLRGAVCNNSKVTSLYYSTPMDPNSYSRPDLAVVTNIFMSLDINFPRKVLSGNTDLTVKKVDSKVNEVILDVKDLKIEAIYETQTNERLKYTVCKDVFGSKLTVTLPTTQLEQYVVSVRYETSPGASGLQWLTPEQTAGKNEPFVFSQFQAIHARSVIPCQDTPAVKTTYSAVISVPKDITVVMSAINIHKKSILQRYVYYFEQKVPIQSYLIALAAGALESREIGPRSKVWAEKELVKEAAYEFGNTERQLKIAEELCGPYVWGIYDILVLPPSFPFGGMENPCLTFVTPTLLAGDRSLANVVAHEIAHSWTGNLVTNANFEHFWLNEGFTVFIERKILGKLKDRQLEDFQAYGGYLELEETVKRLGEGSPFTKLVVNLNGVDPDDAFSSVPYEKGYIFLKYLECIVGGSEIFETFLRTYFDTFKYKSITTDVFKEYFLNYFTGCKDLKRIDWETWLHAPGMPKRIPDYDQTLRKKCEDYIKLFITWDGKANFPIETCQIKALIPDQKIQFLQLLLNEKPQSINKLQTLEIAFNLTNVRNCEMKFRWFRICIKAHWDDKIELALQWLNEIGRMKYTRPLYRDLVGWDKSKNRAIENFKTHRSSMMHVSAHTIAKDLGLPSTG